MFAYNGGEDNANASDRRGMIAFSRCLAKEILRILSPFWSIGEPRRNASRHLNPFTVVPGLKFIKNCITCVYLQFLKSKYLFCETVLAKVTK